MKQDVCVQTKPGPQKQWSSPKLKKIDIEQITAAFSTGTQADSFVAS